MPDEAPPPPNAPEREHSTEQLLADRRRKLDRLREEFGLDPYGQRIDGLTTLADAAAQYDEAADLANKDNPETDERPTVRVAGRVMAHRVMGNLIFMSLRDATGDLQVAVSKKAVGQPAFSIAKMTDLSDIVAAAGPLAKTKTGEITVWAAPSEPSETSASSVSSEPGESSVSSASSEPGRAAPVPAPDPDPDPDPDRADTARLAPRLADPSAYPSADALAAGFAIASKSLALPPGKFHGLTDPETRYRKRYVDLYANPDVMQTMRKRIAIIDAIRDYLRGRGFAEVETPMLQSIHGGAAARPFQTHHNALDLPLTLRIAPELYLKRLLVGGMPKVFEINRNFRNEGISPRHNPEFTMLELYEAFGNWETMAALVEDMICTVAEQVCGGLILNREDAKGNQRTINLTRPWRRVRMDELVEERTGWTFKKNRATPSELRQILEHIELRTYRQLAHQACQLSPVFSQVFKPVHSIAGFEALKPEIGNFLASQVSDLQAKLSLIDPTETVSEDRGVTSELDLIAMELGRVKQIHKAFSLINDQQRVENALDDFSSRFRAMSPAEQLVEVYEKLIEPTLIDPCFVTHVPSVIIPLAKKNADDPYFADVYELAINGVEISPGYTELNDPQVQEQNFRGQVGDKAEQQQVDEDFLEALRVGMPPAGGLGLGIDRLVMMLLGAESIRDVILFPLMRPVESGKTEKRKNGK